MKNLALLIILTAKIVTAQNPADSLIKQGWNPGGVVGVNLSQIAFKDWTQGGSNSLAYSLFSNFEVIYFNNPWKWRTSIKAAYGRTKLEDQGYRTTDNEFYFESILARKIGWPVDPYFALTIRSSITKGYDYKSEPTVQITDFFDPGYVSQALGFQYAHGKMFSSRLGIALQQTFANKFAAVYTDDIETTNKLEDFKFDTGIESVTEVKYNFYDNMTYLSFLRLFSRFNSIDVWDVRWDNTIAAKVNDYITVNFNVVLVHEVSQSRRTQIKEAINIGITYSLF
ncbi:MAG: DUF3078 domain-containing protein [Ignavibacterium album]|uniref:DUF3078 domain-containing protein n=1 Tax=Ignavibacterium album TaxID=591197 RepID=UPI0026EFCE78|nr:DUF3078 domain-containing protein [Ignavibacterium album]MBI5662103.1 DUF3078 domain-containing protein [Ignavibacterium album]